MIELLYDVNLWCAVCIIVIIAVSLVVVKSHLKKLVLRQISDVRTNATKDSNQENKIKNNYPYELTLKVEGMDCLECAERIKNMLNRHQGIWTKADIYTQKVTILFKKKKDAYRFCHDIKEIHPSQMPNLKVHRRKV